MSRSVWGRVQQAILKILDSTTLADLVREEAQHAASHASFVPLDSLTLAPVRGGVLTAP